MNRIYKYHPDKPCCPGTASEAWGPSGSPECSSWYQLGFLRFQLFHTKKPGEIQLTNAQIDNGWRVSSTSAGHSDI